MLTVLQEKLGYTTMASEFKQCSMLWGVVRQNIKEELILPPISRVNCATFLTFVRKSYNQVYNEGTSKIPHNIRILKILIFQMCVVKLNTPKYIWNQLNHMQI